MFESSISRQKCFQYLTWVVILYEIFYSFFLFFFVFCWHGFRNSFTIILFFNWKFSNTSSLSLRKISLISVQKKYTKTTANKARSLKDKILYVSLMELLIPLYNLWLYLWASCFLSLVQQLYSWCYEEKSQLHESNRRFP